MVKKKNSRRLEDKIGERPIHRRERLALVILEVRGRLYSHENCLDKWVVKGLCYFFLILHDF